jgi:DNA-binding XRE family transcriptional regulator
MNKRNLSKAQSGKPIIVDVQEFLGLSAQEMALIDLKVSLVRKLKESRKKLGITQKQLAKLIQSSQSRIAMLEGGAPDVSMDLICRALFAVGVSFKEIGKAISSRKVA